MKTNRKQRKIRLLLTIAVSFTAVINQYATSPAESQSSPLSGSGTRTALQALSMKRDTMAQAARYRELTERKTELEGRILEAESLRNARVEGVTLEEQEIINERQDSLCLSLHSELLAVTLEMEEIMPRRTLGDVLSQSGLLRPQRQSVADSVVVQPAVPSDTPAQQIVQPGGQTNGQGDGQQGFYPYVEVVSQQQTAPARRESDDKVRSK